MNLESSLRRGARRLRPWTGLVLGPLAWLALQQTLGTLIYRACDQGGPPLGPALGVVASLTCAVGAAVSAHRLAASGRARFVGQVSAGVASLLAFACILLTLSAVLVPSCAR